MINLLPPEVVKELRASRANTMLRRYLITALLAFIVLIGIFGGALYINQQNLEAYEQNLEESEAELAELGDIKQRIADYNEKLATAEEALAAEQKMTVLIANLSSVLPPGSVLSGISFNAESFEEPVSIQAQVDSFNKAGVMKRNFAQSEFFTDVVLQQISEQARQEGEGPSAYPFTVQLQVTLTEEATQKNPETDSESEAAS